MPIYTYKCSKCATTKEVLTKMNEPQKILCCGEKMNKIISKPSQAQFLGSGFYQTDYKK